MKILLANLNMNQMDKVVQNDPLKLKAFDKGSSSVTSKTMYLLLVGIPLCFVFAFIFYLLSSSGSREIV